MARIRTIKPGFFFNEELAALPAITRLFFIGLWTQVDREGRCEDRPTRLKASLFPYENVDVEGMILELVAYGHLVRYSVAGVKVLAVPNFLKHQIPHYKEVPSILPEITIKSNVDSTSLQRVSTLSQSCTQEGKGREGKEIAPSPTVSEPAVLVFKAVGKKEWNLTASKLAEWTEAYPGVDVLAECKKARQWAIDNPGKNKTVKGHPAFLSRWLSRTQDSWKSKPAPAASARNEQEIANAKYKQFKEREAAGWVTPDSEFTADRGSH